jgi:putative SOS response-associated peptidase YedK
MKKYIGIVFAAMIVAGCTNSAKEVVYPVMPPELKDCKVYAISSESGRDITVMRCPNATTSTTYKEGKATRTTIVVDGVEYQPVQEPKDK